MDGPNGTQARIMLAVTALFFVLSWLTIAVRLYVRRFILQRMGADDWSMIFAQAVLTACYSADFVSLAYGSGVHIQYLRSEDAEVALKYWFISAILYIVGTCALKVSIGMFLLRCTTSQAQSRCVWAVQIASIVSGIGYLCFGLNICRPMSFWWDLSPDATGTCLSPHIVVLVGYIAAAGNAVADLVYALIPAVILWGSLMDRRTKIVAWCLLSFASTVVIATFVRVPYIARFNGYKGDFLYETIPVSNLAIFELGLGVVVANLATLRPLVQRIWSSSEVTLARSRYTHARGDQEIYWYSKGANEKSDWVGNRPSGPIRNMTGQMSLTGHESIHEIPDLLLAQEIDSTTSTETKKDIYRLDLALPNVSVEVGVVETPSAFHKKI